MSRDTRSNLMVAAGLLVLLGLAALVWSLDLGVAGYLVGLGIAATKAVVIATFFMELRDSSGLTRIVAGAAIYWMVLLLALTLADVMFR